MALDKKTVPVVEIKKLGSQSPTFDLPVKVQKLDGTAVQVTLHCKALRKTVWAKLRDDNQRENAKALLNMTDEAIEPTTTESVEDARQKALDAALDAIKKRGFEFNVKDGIDRNSTLVMQFAEGWELEDAFNVSNLGALDDEYGGFLAAAIRDYDQAIYQGKLGN